MLNHLGPDVKEEIPQQLHRCRAVLSCNATEWSYKCRAVYIALPGRTGSCTTGLWLLDDWTPLGLECIYVEWKVIIWCDTCTELQ